MSGNNGNTSASGGYLQPLLPSDTSLRPGLPSEEEDDALAALFQQMIVGITGIDGALVRPRWQLNPAPRPEPNVNWCSIGVTDNDPLPDSLPYVKYSTQFDADGHAIGMYANMQSHWRIICLVSFYGPKTGYYSALLSDGLSLGQNREALGQKGLKLRRTGDVTKTAELVNTLWYGRADVSLEFVRQIDRDYAIENLVSVPITLTDDYGPPAHSTTQIDPLP